jgi:hypothetical protein
MHCTAEQCWEHILAGHELNTRCSKRAKLGNGWVTSKWSLRLLILGLLTLPSARAKYVVVLDFLEVRPSLHHLDPSYLSSSPGSAFCHLCGPEWGCSLWALVSSCEGKGWNEGAAKACVQGVSHELHLDSQVLHGLAYLLSHSVIRN